ncbi:MAG: alkaline phosphatase family protein, partial [Thermoplasmata archaeon]|nr:alkaline phosphatase family protein [Thermoplasmata archaeon]
GEGYSVSLSVEGYDDTKWQVDITPQSVDFIVPANPDGPGGTKETVLTVTSIGSIDENEKETFVVVASDPEDNFLAQKQVVEVRLNDYEPKINIEDRYQSMSPGNIASYPFEVINNGEKADSIGLSYDSPRGWGVQFESTTGGTPNLDNIAPSSKRSVVAKVSVPDDPLLKYCVEPIEIIATSLSHPDDQSIKITETLVVERLFCISDNENVGSGKYYDMIAGHNVNPGSMTTYVIEIYNNGKDTDKDIEVSLNYGSHWVSDGWSMNLERNGVSITDNSGVLIIPNTDIPDLNDKTVLYLNITVPMGEDIGMSKEIDMLASAVGTGIVETMTITTYVSSTAKTIWIMLNGVNDESLSLDYSEGGSLWPNLNQLISEGYQYNEAYGVQLVGADPNFIAALTSSRTDEHGIFMAAVDYTGLNSTTGESEWRYFNHDDVEVDEIFNTIKDMDPTLRTGVVNAKYWLTALMNDEDVDVAIDGAVHPHYIDEEEAYHTGRPSPNGKPVPEFLAKHQCSDEWIFESAKRAIMYEDVDFLFISNVEPDNAGHIWGTEVDPTGSEAINTKAKPLETEYAMHNTDTKLGSFFDYMRSRSGTRGTMYDTANIIVNADHGMSTFHTVSGDKKLDVKEWLEGRGYFQGEHYEYIQSGGAQAVMYFRPDQSSYISEVKSLLTNEYTISRTSPMNPLWKVLDRTDMQTGVSDAACNAGQPYALYIDSRVNGETDYDLPDLVIIPKPNYAHMIYYGGGDLLLGAGNPSPYELEFMDSYEPLPNHPLNWKYIVGGHASYSEQHVPLIFHGPGIRTGNSDGFVEILQIAPTICALQGWNIDGRYFSDHQGYQPLYDCFDNIFYDDVDTPGEAWYTDATVGPQWVDNVPDGTNQVWRCGYPYSPGTHASLESSPHTMDDPMNLFVDFDVNYELEGDTRYYGWLKRPTLWQGSWPPFHVPYIPY